MAEWWKFGLGGKGKEKPEPPEVSMQAQAIVVNPSQRERVIRSLTRMLRLLETMEKPTIDAAGRASRQEELNRRKALLEAAGIQVPITKAGLRKMLDHVQRAPEREV